MKSISNQGSEIGLNKWYWTQRLSIWKKGKVRALLHTIKTAYLVSLCFTLLHFADTTLKKKRKVGGNPTQSKSICAIFSTAFAHFMSLCHILVFLEIFQTLHYQKHRDSLKAQMMVSFFFFLIKHFIIKVSTAFCYTLSRLWCKHNFYMHWETKQFV